MNGREGMQTQRKARAQTLQTHRKGQPHFHNGRQHHSGQNCAFNRTEHGFTGSEFVASFPSGDDPPPFIPRKRHHHSLCISKVRRNRECTVSNLSYRLKTQTDAPFNLDPIPFERTDTESVLRQGKGELEGGVSTRLVKVAPCFILSSFSVPIGVFLSIPLCFIWIRVLPDPDIPLYKSVLLLSSYHLVRSRLRRIRPYRSRL